MAEPVGGLRERKKERTRVAIRQQALQLFREQGYDATTVEQIAAATDISSSTFFRYFPSKQSIVVVDEYPNRIVRAFDAQPHDMPLLQAMRTAIRSVLDDLSDADQRALRERNRLVTSTPELRTAAMDNLFLLMSRVCDSAAERRGCDPEGLELRAFAWMVHGVLAAASLHWIDHDGASLADSFDTAFEVLEHASTFSPAERSLQE